MVSVHSARMAINVRPKLHGTRKNRKQLLISGRIVAFRRQVLVAMKMHWVETIRVLLQENTTHRKITGITLHDKGLTPVRQFQHRGSTQAAFQLLKSGLLLFPPQERTLW